MTETPTPLLFKDSGDGWHFRPRRRLLLLGGALLVAALLAFGATRALADDKVLAAVLLLVFAAAFAALPFDRSRRRLPPTTYDGPEGRGTLLPVHAVRVVVIGALLVFGLLLVVTPVLAVMESRDDGAGDLVLAVAVSLFLLVVGVLLLVGAYGGVRSRLTPSKGILLTPTRVVLRTQAEPVSFDWEVLRAVRPHWNRRRPLGDLLPSPEDQIHNWLSLDVEEGRYEGDSPLHLLSGTRQPTLDAEKIASDPDAVLAFCRHYLAHQEARAELGTPAALDRFRSLGPPS